MTNCIPVNQAHAIDFEDRFVHRINHVDEAPGFIRNEVLRPDPRQFDHASGTWKEEAGEGGAVYRIATLWETMEHFIDWTKSPSFALAFDMKAFERSSSFSAFPVFFPPLLSPPMPVEPNAALAFAPAFVTTAVPLGALPIAAAVARDRRRASDRA